MDALNLIAIVDSLLVFVFAAFMIVFHKNGDKKAFKISAFAFIATLVGDWIVIYATTF
ncbi:MAG: hypothetical protein LBM73_01475 [Candidatus Nomurabacteria bacterium]|jgi:hypothetical protein|nr:hypothetical protein [Candidatus Nomurabacteria bacterium]